MNNNLFITQDTNRANELNNSTDLLEIKHTYVILLIHSFISDLFFQYIALSHGSGKNHFTVSGVCKLEPKMSIT